MQLLFASEKQSDKIHLFFAVICARMVISSSVLHSHLGPRSTSPTETNVLNELELVESLSSSQDFRSHDIFHPVLYTLKLDLPVN